MKNFTNNFKQFTSHLGARWIIMALMMLVGTSSAWAWTVYYDNTETKWSTVYLVIGHDGYRRGDYKMTKVSGYDNLYSYTATDWTDAKYVAFSKTSVAASSTALTSLGIPYYTFDANMTNANNKIFGGTAYVTDKAQLALNGYIAFYIGEPTSWNQSNFYIWKTENSKNSYQAGTNVATQGSNKLQIVYAKSGTYYLTHSASWNGVSTGAVKAGYGYYIGDGNVMKTLTPTTAPSFTFSIETPISQGSTSTVSSESATGKSMYGTQTVALDAYYIQKDGETTFTKLTMTGSALQTQGLGIGTYQVIPIIYDGKMYFKGTPQTLTVETSCEEPSVTLTNNTVTYNGNPQEPTITIEGGATPTTVKYHGTAYANGPTNAGTYTVTVWADANGDYCELEGAEAGDFIIEQKTPESTDFTYTTSKTYNKTALSADVAWKTGTGSGQITTYYKVQGADDSTYSNTAPTNAGTYTVAVTTAADGNYGLVTKLPLGDFEIKQANQETLTISNATTSLCASSVTLTTSGGSGEGTVSYEITANSAGASINGNTLTATQSGSVTVEATKAADNNYNEITSASKTFTFTLLSAPTFTGTSATACKNTAFNLNSLFTRNDGGAGTLEWYTVNNDTKVDNPANVTIEETTYYYAKVKDGNCYSEKSANVTVTINMPNISGITITPSTNSITVNATIAGSDLKSMQVEAAVGNDWANAIKGETSLTGSNSYSCTVNGLQEGTTYNVRVGANTSTCPEIFTYAAVQETTTTCSAKPAPAITDEATICPNTDTPLSNFNNGVANVLWYTDANCTQSASATVSIDTETRYYARVKNGNCYSETASLTLFVYEAPAAPQLSPSGTINVGQNKSTTITVNNMDANATYVCYNANDQEVGTWNGNSVTFNVGDATGNFTYSIVATNKTCDDLTATTEFTVKVEEAGVKIAALGSTALYTNDPTHFIPMYVSNEDLAGVGATSVEKYTWQFSANGTSGWTDCTRNYGNFNAANNQSDSKVVISNGSDKSNNYRANQVGYYRCKLTYDNDEEQVSGNIQVTDATNNKTNKQHIGITYNLPIISVNTGAKNFPSDAGLATESSNCGSSRYPSIHADDIKKKISVDVMMFNPDGTICYDRKARMNYRGSSSLNFKKKSYAFVTGKEKTKNLDGDVDTGKANLFGLSNGAEDKDWVLYAATPDPSMMRNRLVFDLYQKMRPGEWGVNSMYVELVVNGEYRGVYVLMDKITCNANRVNIKNENGFIVKFDKTDVVDRVENTDGDQKTFATSRTGTKNSSNGIESYGSCIDQRFEIEYPEKEDIELWDAFYGNVQQRFENFETALANKDYATVRTLIDYDSWADWFIITELAKNQDGFRASCIFVYDGDKIEARPLWDQELSFNNGTRVKHGIDSPEGLLITTSSVYSDAFYPPFWFTGNKGTSVTGGLLNDPCFVSLVKQKWATYQSGVCSAASIGDMVADYNTELGNAINREAARWPYTEAARGTTTDGDYIGYYSQGEGNPDQYSYADSKGAITAWASDRSTALDANSGLGKAINDLNGEALIFTLSPSSVETTPWTPVLLTVNAPEGYDYTIDYSAITNAGGTVKESNNSYACKLARPTDNGWVIGGNGGDAQDIEYKVTASIEVSGENACGTIDNNTATATITLQDITEGCEPEIKP